MSDEKQKLWQQLATIRRRRNFKLKALVEDRGVPKTPEEQLELVASIMQSNHDLAKLLVKVAPADQRTAYEQMRTRVSFKVEEFDSVMRLANQVSV